MIQPTIDVWRALRNAAAVLRGEDLPSFANGAEALHSALCAAGASASVRFRALGFVRLEVLGSEDAGDLSGAIAQLMPYELAELCDRAAVLR